ncbi:sporulation integral membrane protein YlbJ [Gracilibacillus sp. YIM 98692]|uniref:sporulation integral membrane protein YlbJ n=1 Tax=Gracilibacillus sp. YIM 98692 TaxID=2663532 RepID=UPI001F097E41|nr:sporulation integral membrane protein YlbJ [Gracilibacillus sp. YIM 98692]
MKDKSISILYAFSSLFIAISIIYFPQAVLQASQRGLEMWASTVFPSLLPFFIIAELLIGFGVVHFVGVLCEPFMRPFFNVSGVGGFVWTMGMASGYPSGAKFTARLRQEQQLTKTEAERLVSFTNSSNPLFIIGAVSIGFFHDHQLGILLAITHYTSNFLVGICMRFYKYKEPNTTTKTSFSIKRAFTQLHVARMQDRRPLGKILGDAIIQSIQTLLLIGGFIILFSVLTQILREVHIAHLISQLIEIVLQWWNLPKELALPLFTGLFEITIGANEISQLNSSVLMNALIVSFILGFNGLSVQAQVASILAETDIRFAPYFFARLLHGVLACLLVLFFFIPIYENKLLSSSEAVITMNAAFHLEKLHSWIVTIGPTFTILALAIYLFTYLLRKTS